jgi:methionyl-tRNA synthetase
MHSNESADVVNGKDRMSDSFYITTPIYYINDVPHLGHAYTEVAADFLARFHRLLGGKVTFLTGTDEHGQKIAQAAEAKGMSPKEWADEIVPRWHEVWKALDISYDDFIRTTEARHESPVQKFVQELYDRGEIYLGAYEGLYCVGCEAFKTPEELVDGRCPLHPSRDIETIAEENYFFRLGKYADRLLALWESDDRSVLPEVRRNEVISKVKGGLDDLSISRVSFDWGIPIPWDDKHVIYVWVDALLNYITAAGYGSDEDRFARVWPADVHLVGKDILWFHSVIWPAMLMALDLPVPRTVYAHGFLLVGGAKMSKSSLTGISPHDLIETFGSDGYRYYFLREVSFGQDGTFSWETMLARFNSDLANDFGNLAARVLNMVGRYLDGEVPQPPSDSELEEADRRLVDAYDGALAGMKQAVEAFSPTEALKAGWTFVAKANAYVEEVAPWKLAKDDARRRRLEVVLYNLAEALRVISLLTWPATPRVSQELWRRLGIAAEIERATFSAEGRWGGLVAGSKTTKGDALFQRLEADEH